MTDKLLSPSDQKEALSRVYAHAVATRAGYVAATPEYDRDSVDIRISAGGAMRPALDIQLKATTRLPEPRDGHLRFPLSRRNYDHLIQETQTPRLLMVMDLPEDAHEWLTITEECLILRRRAFWLNLAGCPECSNVSSITVDIPVKNRFDVTSLRDLMNQSRSGTLR